MKIITTIISTDLVTNLSFLTNQKQEPGFQQVGGLVTKKISVFVYSELRSTSKPCQIQQAFTKEFSYMLFLFVLQFHEHINLFINARLQRKPRKFSENPLLGSRVLSLRSHLQGPRSWVLGTTYELDPRSWFSGPIFKVPGLESRVPPLRWVLGLRSWVPPTVLALVFHFLDMPLNSVYLNQYRYQISALTDKFNFFDLICPKRVFPV